MDERGTCTREEFMRISDMAMNTKCRHHSWSENTAFLGWHEVFLGWQEIHCCSTGLGFFLGVPHRLVVKVMLDFFSLVPPKWSPSWFCPVLGIGQM